MTKDFSSYKHSMRLKVRFSDLDALGHVNNARYLTFYEEARIAFFEDVVGLSKGSTDWKVVVAKVEINFRSSIRLGDEVEIRTRVAHIGSKSYQLESVILVLEDGKERLASDYRVTLVSYDFHTGKTIPVPEKSRELMNAFKA